MRRNSGCPGRSAPDQHRSRLSRTLRFVLATGKDFAHRIYIGNHLYADLTLMYIHKQFVPLDWTYPDYQSPEIHRFLEQVRDKYQLDLKAKKAQKTRNQP